jgi:hypothetical protein
VKTLTLGKSPEAENEILLSISCLKIFSTTMRLPFQRRKTFTTPLSAEEAVVKIRELINTKTKILFFSIGEYTGSIDGNEFSLGKFSGESLGLFTSKIKGSIRLEDRTLVETRISLPYLPIIFYLIFPVMFLKIIFSVDEMNINGVLRRPEIYETIGMCFFVMLVPAIGFFMTTIRPILQTEARLKEILKLEKQGAIKK